MSGKGCVSFSQTVTMSGSRWGFISGYSESLFFKRLTRVTSVNWERSFLWPVLWFMWRLLTKDQTLLLLLLGHICNSPSSPAMREASVLPVEEETATLSSILARGHPRTEGSGGLQYLGSRVRHNLPGRVQEDG